MHVSVYVFMYVYCVCICTWIFWGCSFSAFQFGGGLFSLWKYISAFGGTFMTFGMLPFVQGLMVEGPEGCLLNHREPNTLQLSKIPAEVSGVANNKSPCEDATVGALPCCFPRDSYNAINKSPQAKSPNWGA